MPSPPNQHGNNCLTTAGQRHISVYRQQGLTLAAIAKKMGCSISTVWNHLQKTPHTVAINYSQYRIIKRFEQSGLALQDLATRLGIDSLILSQELAGTKTMSTNRVGQIKRVLAENPDDEKAPT
jgi:transcriptional regulator with XRE-family HTH domain